MKIKTLLFIGAISGSSLVIAQNIENPGFENWKSDTIGWALENWMGPDQSFVTENGGFSQSTDAFEGNFSLKS